MAAQKGSLFLLKAGDGGGPEVFTTVGGLRTTSFNVNISTLLSPEFLEFDRKLRLLTKKTLIFELQPIDVFDDMSGFMFARDFVRARGYRICLDRLNYLTLPYFDRPRLGCDFEKLIWEAGLPRDIDA